MPPPRQGCLSQVTQKSRTHPPARLFGKNYRLGEVLANLPPETLAFAAHPFDAAQVPPARWTQDDLRRARLTGYEFWNSRSRASAG